MAKKQFKAESKRLLDLMVNSIYTHKEIFLRELISNASDAIDKLCYIALRDEGVGMSRDDFRIDIYIDREKRTITVSDNGVGMTAEELESNLGVIARSGSLQFKKELGEKKEDVEIIGQFGVGFYSAFMVASKVTVISRAYGQEQGNMWVSTGSDGYAIEPHDRPNFGTDVILELKPDTDDEKYSEFLDEHTVRHLIKKYSDYIRWPIYMDVTKSRRVETEETDSDGKRKTVWEDYTEREVVNSRVPIWQRTKSEVPDEECIRFYKEKFYDFDDPVSVIRISAEGAAVSYRAMLFIPAKAPYDYYTREYQAGLQLYASGVLIMEHCSDLLPEHFRFVRGVVDSPDLSLNISREMLQHDRQLKIIASNIEKKVKAELKRLLESEYDKYVTFYKSFGLQLKYGILSGFGANREMLSDLIMFYSAREARLIPIAEYVKNMKEDQKYIYYACGDSMSRLDKLPQAEVLRERGYDILYLTEDVDEFVVRTLSKFEGKEFRSVNDDLGLESEEEKKEAEKKESENRDVLDFVKESLGEKVAAVRLSGKLRSHPACLSTQGGVTLEMERYFASLKNGPSEPIKAERVLELNPDHAVFSALKQAVSNDREKAKKYAELLYGQAQLIAGDQLCDPVRFAELVSELMA